MRSVRTLTLSLSKGEQHRSQAACSDAASLYISARMKTETERAIAEIQQAVALLRRHL